MNLQEKQSKDTKNDSKYTGKMQKLSSLLKVSEMQR